MIHAGFDPDTDYPGQHDVNALLAVNGAYAYGAASVQILSKGVGETRGKLTITGPGWDVSGEFTAPDCPRARFLRRRQVATSCSSRCPLARRGFGVHRSCASLVATVALSALCACSSSSPSDGANTGGSPSAGSGAQNSAGVSGASAGALGGGGTGNVSSAGATAMTAGAGNVGVGGAVVGGAGQTAGGADAMGGGNNAGCGRKIWRRRRQRNIEERHVISFKNGRPAGLDGQTLAPVDVIERLETLAAPFGIGRGIHLGDTIIGTKGRVAFEAPAAETLLTAHRELEKLVLTGRQQRIKELVSQPYGDLVHEGQLLDPVCRDIEALLLSSQERVTGDVHVLFRPGNLFIEGVESPYSLMAASKGVYGESVGEWTPADALGFSKIVSLTGVFHHRAGERAQGA